jgi:hypothetical protein
VLSGAPFGYPFIRKTDHSAAYYEIDEEQARVVRQIFELYCVQGLSIGAIARLTNEQAVPTCKRRGRWGAFDGRGVNAVGNVATGEALKRFDADGEPIVVAGAKLYSKGKLSKIYDTPYGVVSAERHVYQPAEGGTTFCTMDVGARIIRKATPRFAKMVSHKFAHGAAAQVMDDLEQDHGRPCLKASLQDLATHVATVVQAKEESWSYATPEFGKVATVGIGVDGTCMLSCNQKWREAMTGSISLYDKRGERLHTIYVGAAPEYGKGVFQSREARDRARKVTIPTRAFRGYCGWRKIQFGIFSVATLISRVPSSLSFL